MQEKHGYTLVFVLGMMALLAAVAAMIAGPSSMENRRVDFHYRQLQAQYLSLGGLEEAKVLVAQGTVTNRSFTIANGTVDIKMKTLEGKLCHVMSTGSIQAPGRKTPIQAQIERIISLP